MTYPLMIGAILVIVGSCLVTWILWRDQGAETKQKIYQTFFIWLIPGFGAFIVYWIVSHWEQKHSRFGDGHAIQGEEGNDHFSGAG